MAIENYLECYHCATSHRAYAKMHTLKDLEEKSAPVVAKMLENADAITGIPGISKEHTEIYLDAELAPAPTPCATGYSRVTLPAARTDSPSHH